MIVGSVVDGRDWAEGEGSHKLFIATRLLRALQAFVRRGVVYFRSVRTASVENEHSACALASAGPGQSVFAEADAVVPSVCIAEHRNPMGWKPHPYYYCIELGRQLVPR